MQMYADDTLTYKSEYLDELRDFASNTKFNKIPREKRIILVGGKKICFSESVKTLGVTLDRDMK